MIVVLYEDPNNVISSAINVFYRKYPKSCRVNLGRGAEVSFVDTLKEPPLLSDGWFISCSTRVSTPVIKQLSKQKQNLVLFRVTNLSIKNRLIDSLDENKIEYKVIDNYKLDREVVYSYILSKLNTNRESAMLLYKRHNGYIKDIVSSVNYLSYFPTVTRADIIKYTKSTLNIAPFDILNFMLGIDYKHLKYENIIKTLQNYKYAYKYLKKYFITALQEYIYVFDLLDSGELRLDNYAAYRANSNDKILTSMSEFRLKSIIEAFDTVSIEYVYFLLGEIKSCGEDRFNLYKLVLLIKACK